MLNTNPIHSFSFVFISCLLLCSVQTYGQNIVKDSSSVTENSAIFLNASSDSKPREVSLGLPTNATSAVQIFEDGLPVSYYIYHLYPYKSWHGGSSAASTGTIGPIETAMRYGEINNFVDSYNRLGSQRFRGNFNYTYGQYGQNKVDFNVSGPLPRGFQYSLSTYQNSDPGSNHIIYPYVRDRHQFYKAALSRPFNVGRGSVSLVYQYVNYLSIQENFGPFVFVGDGSVKEYEGFDLGIDSYRPEGMEMEYMDFKTGEMKSVDLKDGNRDKTHHLTFNIRNTFDNGSEFVFRSRLKNGTSVRGAGTLAGIEDLGTKYIYSDANGHFYHGLIQKRNLLHFDTFEMSFMNNAEYTWNSGNHSFRAGADLHLNHGGTITSSAQFAHTVESDPKNVYVGYGAPGANNKFFSFNTAGEFYDGYENKYAVYLKDSWNATRDMNLDAFVRLERLYIHGDSANNIGNDTSNNRYPSFNLTYGKITPFKNSFLNGAAGIEGVYRIGKGFSIQADATFTRVHANIFNYGGYYDPNTDPTDTYFARFGFAFRNSWLNVLSQLTYISQSNYNTRSVFQHVLQKDAHGQLAGTIESVTLPLTYGISSFGWITDAIVTPFDHFTLHLMLTLRNPEYRDFSFSPSFSDGISEHYDFSGNNVTNLNKVEFSVDPSYSLAQWRFWLSARYLSKQYINKTNSLFFKGRVETFGGIDFKVNDSTKLTLNVVNILNQKGASGLISSADLVVDASSYKDYVMSGTFIRPFTVELGISVDF